MHRGGQGGVGLVAMFFFFVCRVKISLKSFFVVNGLHVD